MNTAVLNRLVDKFYIEYSDHTVITSMPRPGQVNFWVLLAVKHSSQREQLKKFLAEYGISGKDDELDGDKILKIRANYDDEIIAAMGEVLKQRERAKNKGGVFKQASQVLEAAAKKANKAFRGMFSSNQKKR